MQLTFREAKLCESLSLLKARRKKNPKSDPNKRHWLDEPEAKKLNVEGIALKVYENSLLAVRTQGTKSRPNDCQVLEVGKGPDNKGNDGTF